MEGFFTSFADLLSCIYRLTTNQAFRRVRSPSIIRINQFTFMASDVLASDPPFPVT